MLIRGQFFLDLPRVGCPQKIALHLITISASAFEWFASLLAAIEEQDLDNVRQSHFSEIDLSNTVHRNSHLSGLSQAGIGNLTVFQI